MAGNKTVPLTLGIGGPVIGTATIDENGIVMAEIDSMRGDLPMFFAETRGLSIYTEGP